MSDHDLRLDWRKNVAHLDHSIVGVIEPEHGGWFAYGCLNEWQDTPIGFYLREDDAKKRVYLWVTRNV